ncbi:MAG: OmpH family outer membrane protein [Bacteroidota bacterium]
MKNILTFAFLSLLCFASVAVQAQSSQKIGYTSINYIFSQLPDAKRIEAELKAHQSQLENSIQAKVKDLREKADVYEKLPANTSEVIRGDKEKELQTLQTSLQEFQRNAQTDLQKKESTLVQPVIKKIYDLAAEVGKENGYGYILNSDEANPILILAPKENDISDLVLKKMGVTPGQPKPAPASVVTPKSTAPTPKK